MTPARVGVTTVDPFLPVVNPWEAPWWRAHPSQRLIFVYLIVLHVLGALGLFLFPRPGAGVLLTALIFAVLGGFGTTVAYHRALAHRALKLHPWVEQVLIFFAVWNGSGSPRSWVANHRLHHAAADKDEDISSPKHGFWWSHLRWLYQRPDADPRRYCPDLAAPRYERWTRAQPFVVALSIVAFAPFGLEALFWAGVLRLLFSLHGQCCVNSVAHMGRDADGKWGVPQNVWWLGPLQLGAWGENWHVNHHNDASSARLGRGGFQVDIGWVLIGLLEKLGLATAVRRPSPAPRPARPPRG